MSDEAVQAKTGKTWPEWFSLLDAAGARRMNHKEIVAWLVGHHGLGPWWQQMVTVAYEPSRGLRQVHEKPEGFQIGKSRTFAVPLDVLYGAFRHDKTRARWLADSRWTLRVATENQSLRATWIDGKTVVEVDVFRKGDSKTQVTVQHRKLPSAKAAEAMKAYWQRQLDALEDWLEEANKREA